LDSTNFDALGLNQSLVRALLEAGYTEPTPIQVQAIPKVIAETRCDDETAGFVNIL
jgi:superfamily II DNA/RNA helicase